MGQYLLLIAILVFLPLFLSFNIVRFTHEILKDHIKSKVLCWIISCLPLLLLEVGLYISPMNALVIYDHLSIFILLIKFVLLFIKKKKVSEATIFGCTIVITAIYLTYGYYTAHHVVETDYTVYTEKAVDDFRIVQISDSHIGTTFNGEQFLDYVKKINELKPNIVVITGDFIDNSTKDEDIVAATKNLGKLNANYGVYFIYGNHDKGFVYSKYGILHDNLKENNVMILEDASTEINNIILVGRSDANNTDRVAASELTKELDRNKYIIMLDHQPTDYDNEAATDVDLVLSGHTHGGQIFPLGQIGQLLGFNDMLYGTKKINNTTFIVSSGMSNWDTVFKTGAKSEYVVIDIKKK